MQKMTGVALLVRQEDILAEGSKSISYIHCLSKEIVVLTL